MQATVVTTTEAQPWQVNKETLTAATGATPLVTIHTDKPDQTIDGFGACFNELGWTSLALLTPQERGQIFDELFKPDTGANFNICRVPVGANDFSRDWYSYNEVDGDFAMKNFSIENDKETLIPFIKQALAKRPELKIWGSPWCPPSWMKTNKHYALNYNGDWSTGVVEFDGTEAGICDIYMVAEEKYRNGLPKDKIGVEGTDAFIMEDEYLKAYAKYFVLYIDEYKKNGITIYAIMPQNEFNSCQFFPSCVWKPESLARFVGEYLGPELTPKGVEIMFGTVERENTKLTEIVLDDPKCKPLIKAVGFQWAGKRAIANIHKKYPSMKLWQTEQECGDGRNDWKGAVYSWKLMNHYFKSGASAYMYWNISLLAGGISRWGWMQNSLIVVDPVTKKYHYTIEYYLLKHASHFVKPGAHFIETSGSNNNVLAFKNHDNSIVIIAFNEEDSESTLTFSLNGSTYNQTLKAKSFTTIFVQ